MLIQGDARSIPLADRSVHCCVTSPPYWGLRDYGIDGQIGLEATPDEYIQQMVQVFREVKRVLRDDGTLWLNLGDSYHNGDKGGYRKGRVGGASRIQANHLANDFVGAPNRQPQEGLKPKDLVGIPWMLAFALRADGWYLRSDIIWAKPNPMPESVSDRPTRAHEYLFLMAKSQKYYYDQDAIREPYVSTKDHRATAKWVNGWAAGDTEHTPIAHAVPRSHNGSKFTVGKTAATHANVGQGERADHPAGRNARSVWQIATQPTKDAHFATFPEKLVRPCILAGSPIGGIVLDPFAGAGTTLVVAAKYGRQAIGVELNGAYIEIAKRRLAQKRLDMSAPAVRVFGT